jgi:hypothetical protein
LGHYILARLHASVVAIKQILHKAKLRHYIQMANKSKYYFMSSILHKSNFSLKTYIQTVIIKIMIIYFKYFHFIQIKKTVLTVHCISLNN